MQTRGPSLARSQATRTPCFSSTAMSRRLRTRTISPRGQRTLVGSARSLLASQCICGCGASTRQRHRLASGKAQANSLTNGSRCVHKPATREMLGSFLTPRPLVPVAQWQPPRHKDENGITVDDGIRPFSVELELENGDKAFCVVRSLGHPSRSASPGL